MRSLILVLLATAACTDGSDTGIDDNRIPDPLANPFPYDSGCDGFEGTPVAGAMGWFVGEFDIIGEEVEGFEAWALLTNDTWEAGGEGRDCQVTWNIAGVVGPTENCASCDYSVTLDANINFGASDCHDAFINAADQTFTTTYNVRALSTGVTEVLFASSGNILGTGTSDRDGFSYVTDPRCFFF